jgi:hypothetical protein
MISLLLCIKATQLQSADQSLQQAPLAFFIIYKLILLGTLTHYSWIPHQTLKAI